MAFKIPNHTFFKNRRKNAQLIRAGIDFKKTISFSFSSYYPPIFYNFRQNIPCLVPPRREVHRQVPREPRLARVSEVQEPSHGVLATRLGFRHTRSGFWERQMGHGDRDEFTRPKGNLEHMKCHIRQILKKGIGQKIAEKIFQLFSAQTPMSENREE